jgi:hypothetical protein
MRLAPLITLTVAPLFGVAAARAAPGTRKFGGTPKKSAATTPSDQALAQAEEQLAQIRSEDSPARLFEMMRKADQDTAKPAKKD